MRPSVRVPLLAMAATRTPLHTNHLRGGPTKREWLRAQAARAAAADPGRLGSRRARTSSSDVNRHPPQCRNQPPKPVAGWHAGGPRLIGSVREKGEVLLRGVGTLRYVFPPSASVQRQPDGLTTHANKWFLGAGFLGAPPISLKGVTRSALARHSDVTVCARPLTQIQIVQISSSCVQREAERSNVEHI